MTSMFLRAPLRCSFMMLVASGAIAATPQSPEKPSRPNVLIILADDLGYGDVKAYNPDRGRIATPHIDRLAAQGVRFTDAHSSSGVCSPSRYALLTGRYHWRTRLQEGIVGVFGPPLIAPERTTVASLAKAQGHQTACIGKWHLGWDWPIEPSERPFTVEAARLPAKQSHQATAAHQAAWRALFSRPIPGGPTTRGFDLYFGTDVPNWPPYCFIENDRTVGIPTEFLPAELFRENLASLPGPGLEGWALEPILPTLGDRAAAFIMGAAKGPKPFLLYMPLTAPHTPLAVNAPWRGRSGLNSYADFVMETDSVVGQVLDALEQAGVAERTLVLFTSDNGCAPYIGAAELEAKGHYPSGPLRGYKSSVYEGGHRIPFIVRWPGVTAPGRVCDALVHQADVLATLAEALGVDLPENAGEDSVSFLPLLKGDDRPARSHAVSCGSDGTPGLRQDEWKLILAPGRGANDDAGTDQPVQLYNLADDVGETTNLAADRPERVAAMTALMDELISSGRSTPGAAQPNDVPVRRFPRGADARTAPKLSLVSSGGAQ